MKTSVDATTTIHTEHDDCTSTNPKSMPLEAHAPPQHLILRALPLGNRINSQFT